MEIERRFMPMASDAGCIRVEQRDGLPPIFSGYAATYNSLSENLGGFRELLAPGCFDNALSRASLGAGGGVLALFNHSNDHVLGRSTSGTLRLSSDDQGLAAEIDPPDTQLGRDLGVLVRRGDITGMSFAFTISPKGESFHKDADGMTVRTVSQVDALYDVSIVTVPAYSASSVSMRSFEQWQRSEPKPKVFDMGYRAAVAAAAASAARLRGYGRTR
jgi:HK97 family phage prohead protease